MKDDKWKNPAAEEQWTLKFLNNLSGKPATYSFAKNRLNGGWLYWFNDAPMMFIAENKKHCMAIVKNITKKCQILEPLQEVK